MLFLTPRPIHPRSLCFSVTSLPHLFWSLPGPSAQPRHLPLPLPPESLQSCNSWTRAWCSSVKDPPVGSPLPRRQSRSPYSGIQGPVRSPLLLLSCHSSTVAFLASLLLPEPSRYTPALGLWPCPSLCWGHSSTRYRTALFLVSFKSAQASPSHCGPP